MTSDRVDLQLSAPPNVLYRIVRLLCRAVVSALFKVEVQGIENLPSTGVTGVAGGWIAAGVPHRNWLEPVLLFALLPARPRHVGIAEGSTINRSFLRRNLVRLAGGAILVGRDAGRGGFERVAREANEAIHAGGVVTIFPESGPPSRPPNLRPLSPGVAHIAARTTAPVIPVVFGGSHELYLKRRIVVRVLPSMVPPADTSRPVIAAFMDQLNGRLTEAAAEAHQGAESVSVLRKRWLWLTGNYPRA